MAQRLGKAFGNGARFWLERDRSEWKHWGFH
jgi:plasmid maintenance system antidote protein VapI